MDIWNSLDDAAKANLNGSDLEEFWRYKKRLKDDGHEWDADAEQILTGFIWDCLEGYPDED